MCSVCGSGAGARSLRRVFSRQPRTPQTDCAEPLSYYMGLDTSGWDTFHQALVRSQILNYHKKCNLHHDLIKSLQEHYSEVLPSEGE